MVLELTITSSLHREKTRQRHIGTRNENGKRERAPHNDRKKSNRQSTHKKEREIHEKRQQSRAFSSNWVFHSYNCQIQICMMGNSRIDSASASRSAFSSHAPDPAPAPVPCVVFVVSAVLQSSTTSTSLSSSRVSWDWSRVFNSSNFESRTSECS
jgi:hypothetical protein